MEEAVTVPKRLERANGFTLIELLIAMAVVAALAVLSVSVLFDTFSSKLKASSQNLAEDMRFAQNEAVRQGDANPGGGTFRERKVFVVFDAVAAPNQYAIWRWEDSNGNNVRDAGEFNPNLAGVAGQDAAVRTGTMQSGVTFGLLAGVNLSACGNAAVAPAGAVTFPVDALTPCLGKPCIRFDGKGFIENAAAVDGAVYFTDGQNAYAVSANKAGLFSFCRWNAGAVPPQWVPAH